jgi:hypothetical protein
VIPINPNFYLQSTNVLSSYLWVELPSIQEHLFILRNLHNKLKLYQRNCKSKLDVQQN